MAEHNELGKAGENAAVAYLEEHGYLIRHRNWRKGHFELDIVAAKVIFPSNPIPASNPITRMSAIILRFILYCLLFCQSHTFCMSSFRLTLTIADRFVTKKATHLCAAFSINNRGTRNRTQLWSFGDSYSTDELCPYK